MFGEAVVICNPVLKPDFRYCIKQHGGMLAKGRLLGVQFLELFKDGLYFEISKHAIDMAEKIKEGFVSRGYELLIDSPTNQQFIILDNDKLRELSDKVNFSVWEPYDEKSTVVRFATSWSTTEEDIAELSEFL